MDIEVGKLYRNKTLDYLVPCLNLYGNIFKTKLNSIYNLAFGVHDCILDGTVFEEQRLIYILCDKAYQVARFENFLNYVKNQQYYVMDYAYDDIENGRKHMIVVKFPEEKHDAYDKFLESRYSKMYYTEEIELLINNQTTKDILNKKSHLAPFFVVKLNNVFKTTLIAQDVIDGEMELDFPVQAKEEFFNFKEREE